jgi:hypothetical protein
MASSEGASFSSRQAEETIAPGLVVTPGDTNPATTCALPDSAADLDGTDHMAIGVAVLDPYRLSADYVDGDAVRICVKGDVWVNVATNAAKAGGPVYVTATTGAVDGTTGTQLHNAVFLDAGTGLVRVRLNGPFTAAFASA